MVFIKAVDRNQRLMFPEYADDYIAEDNPVRSGTVVLTLCP